MNLLIEIERKTVLKYYLAYLDYTSKRNFFN